MKKYSMWKGLFALSLLFVFLAALSVQAAETRTPIEHLNLYVDGDRNDGWNEDITLRLSTPDSEYRVGDWYLSNSNTATVPIFKVELYAANGYYFDLSSSDVELSGKEARCTGRSIRDDKETLIITLKVEGLAVDPNSRPRRIVVRNAAGASARRAREGSVASVEFADGARKDGGALASLSRRRLRLFARIVSPVGFGPVFGKRGAGQCRARPKERLAR